MIPAIKQAEYMPDAWGSVYRRATAWECIIVNDGSPDNVEEVVQQWVNRDEF